MQERPNEPDKFFEHLTYALMLFGLCFIVSASWNESYRYFGSPWILIIKHALSVIIGFAAMLFVSYIHVAWARKFAWPIMICVLVGLLLTAKFGIVSGGSRRWLDLGFMNLQISEFAKIACALVISKACVEKKHLWLSIFACLLCTFFVLKQPDLGTSVLVFASGFLAIFAAGLNLLIIFVLACLLLFGAWHHIQDTPYQMERIKYWLDPSLDPLGSGYNLLQSMKAIASGGLWGQGFGASLQKLGPLPIPYADFIFSVVSEELGFLGALVLLLLFFAWIVRALFISLSAQDTFTQIFSFALVIVFALQVIINISVATGLFPVTGITLPFISFGGSSFINSCLIAGIILNISRQH